MINLKKIQELLNKFEKEICYVDIVPKYVERDENTSYKKRVEYVKINSKKFELLKLNNYLKTIYFRFQFLRDSLVMIQKESRNEIVDKYFYKNFDIDSMSVEAQLYINIDYFLFAGKSIFDVMLNFYQETIDKNVIKFKHIDKINSQHFLYNLVEGDLNWLKQFNEIRNTTAHDELFDVSTNFNFENDEIRYSNLNIKNSNFELKKMPEYYNRSIIKIETAIKIFIDIVCEKLDNYLK